MRVSEYKMTNNITSPTAKNSQSQVFLNNGPKWNKSQRRRNSSLGSNETEPVEAGSGQLTE